MVARGEVTLIVVAAAGKAGLVEVGAFSAIVAAVLLTTLVTPPLLRFAFARFPQRSTPPLAGPVVKNEEKKQ